MKILEITAFSSGICGVWTRVQNEAEQLAKKGHEVTVFSSNIRRGSEKIEFAKDSDVLGKVKIKRFKTKGNFGQNTFFWDYEKEALALKPDVIITHVYRQYYSTKALKIAKKLNIPCILVTHAPFLDKNLRSWKLNFAVWAYDTFIGKRILNKYSKILTITKWELPYLSDLGVNKNKIEYLPNGIPQEFFKSKPKKGKGILFLGRIAPIKEIETLINAIYASKIKGRVDIIGPAEEKYKEKLVNLVKKLNLTNVSFLPPIYDLNEKIKLVDKYDLFVLSSKREAMPQALIEVMARGKIVISSKTDGGKEIIQDNKNGFLFEIGNEKELGKILVKVMAMDEKQKNILRKNSLDSVKQFSWENLIEKLERILQNLQSHKNL